MRLLPGAELPSIHLGHYQIENNQPRGWVSLDVLECFSSVANGSDIVAFKFEDMGEGGAGGRVVLDDQNALFRLEGLTDCRCHRRTPGWDAFAWTKVSWCASLRY